MTTLHSTSVSIKLVVDCNVLLCLPSLMYSDQFPLPFYCRKDTFLDWRDRSHDEKWRNVSSIGGKEVFSAPMIEVKGNTPFFFLFLPLDWLQLQRARASLRTSFGSSGRIRRTMIISTRQVKMIHCIKCVNVCLNTSASLLVCWQL